MQTTSFRALLNVICRMFIVKVTTRRLSFAARLSRDRKCFNNLSARNISTNKMSQKVMLPPTKVEKLKSVSGGGASILPISHIRVPVGNAVASVGYVDVGPRDGPLVLVIHGAIGGIKDFTDLLESLSAAGNRIVLPEFPGFGHTTLEGDATFDESTDARAEFVHNFLKTLEIKRVTTVTGHSMGSVTAFHLAANTDMFESLVYLNGIGLSPHKSLRPYWLVRIFARLLEWSWTRYFVKKILLYGYRYMGFEMNESTGLVSATLGASRIGFDQFRVNVERVRDKRLPILFAFTQNDKLVEWQVPLALARHCNLSDDNITWLNTDETTARKSTAEETVYPKALIFERGGHFVHRSRTEIISRNILQLVRYIRSISTLPPSVCANAAVTTARQDG